MPTGKRSQIGLRDLVKTGLLKPGDKLVQRQRNGTIGATARITKDGDLVIGTRHFTTPSGAASLVLDGAAVNGWEFWR